MEPPQDTTESAEQAALVGWLRMKRIAFFAVPNGAVLGGRNRFALLAKLVSEGLTRGAPDIVLVHRAPSTGRPVMLEMKRRTGRMAPEQKALHARARACGWDVVVGWGCKSAINQLERLGF